MEFEHYEALTQTISEEIVSACLGIVESRKVPEDLIFAALDLATMAMIRRSFKKMPDQLLTLAADAMIKAQTGSFQARLEWLKGMKDK